MQEATLPDMQTDDIAQTFKARSGAISDIKGCVCYDVQHLLQTVCWRNVHGT